MKSGAFEDCREENKDIEACAREWQFETNRLDWEESF